MNKIAYISLMKNPENLRKHWPGGKKLPVAWMKKLAYLNPLFLKTSDWDEQDWWWEFFPEDLNGRLPGREKIRARLLRNLPQDWTHIALAPEILKLGGGSFAWNQALNEKKIHLILGQGLNLLSFAALIKEQKPKQILIGLKDGPLPSGLLDLAAKETEFLMVRCSTGQLPQLELWQSRAAYETGAVIRLLSAGYKTPDIDCVHFLVWDEIWQNWQQGRLEKGEKRCRQPLFLLRSQSRRLDSAQAELLLCREKPDLWQKLNFWQNEGCFVDIEQWLEEFFRENLIFFSNY